MSKLIIYPTEPPLIDPHVFSKALLDYMNTNQIKIVQSASTRITFKAEPEPKPEMRDLMKYIKGATPHTWISGPDGQNYHCVVCGISRCDDHHCYNTCESFYVLMVTRLMNGTDLRAIAEDWKDYLNKFR